MRCYIENGTLSVTAKTVNFIEHMDNLFDIFNSRTQVASKDFNRPFKSTSKQRNYLIKMLNIFINMRVLERKLVNGNTVNTDVS